MFEQTTNTPKGRWRRPLLAAVALVAVAAPTAVLAHGTDRDIPPSPGDVTVLGYHGNNELLFTAPLGRVYGPQGGGLAVISGDPVEAVCDPNSVPPETLGAAKQHPDGMWETHTPLGGVIRDAFVYEIGPDENVFAFFGRVCPAIGAGEPAPEPLATGEVRQRDRQWELDSPYYSYEGPQAPGRYRNSIRGDVKGSDGTRYKLFAKADYRINDDGTEELFVDRLKLRPQN